MRLHLAMAVSLVCGCIIQPAPAPRDVPPPPPSLAQAPGQPLVQTTQEHAKLVKIAPYQLEWMQMLPSYVFTRTGAELLYVDATHGALMAVSSAGGKPRAVYVGKVGHVHHDLEDGDALVLVDEKFSVHGNDYSEHYRRIVVSSGASSEIGNDMPDEQRMIHDSALFRTAGVEGVQPFRVGALLAGQTPSKELVVLDRGKVATVCASPGANVAWPTMLGDSRRLAQPANEHLFIADVVARTCVRTDEQLTPPTFIYPVLAGTDDAKWLLYPAYSPASGSAKQSDISLYLADAAGHAKLVATLAGATGVRPVALPHSHTFVYAVNWQTQPHTANTVFFELNADTGAVQKRTCDITTAVGDSTAPDFALSPDGRTIAFAVSAASACGVAETGLYALDLSGR